MSIGALTLQKNIHNLTCCPQWVYGPGPVDKHTLWVAGVWTEPLKSTVNQPAKPVYVIDHNMNIRMFIFYIHMCMHIRYEKLGDFRYIYINIFMMYLYIYNTTFTYNIVIHTRYCYRKRYSNVIWSTCNTLRIY